MESHARTVGKLLPAAAALAVFVSLLSGCHGRCDETVMLTPKQQSVADAVLAAARSKQISMFGDLPGADSSVYQTRSAAGLKQHTFSEEGADGDPDIDRAGKFVVFASTRHHTNPDLYMKSVGGVAVTQLTADPASDIQPAFSPDGSRVAFASDRSGNWDIWVMDVAGGQPVQITGAQADEIHPSWSPDGSKLVYSRAIPGGGQWELWITDVVAGGMPKFIGFGLFPVWSPVGDTIAFQRARARGSHWFSIWTITLVDGEPRYPTELASSTEYAMILPAWNADGSWIAFTSIATDAYSIPAADSGDMEMATGGSDIWLVGGDGTGRVRLTDGHSGNFAPTFSPDGRVFFAADRAGTETIWSLRPAGAAVRWRERGVRTAGEDATPAPAQTTARTVSQVGDGP